MLDRPERAARARSRSELGDPEIDTRIAQYEMAYRMQASVPERDRRLERDRRARSSCTAPTRASRGRSRPTACWRAGWPSAACSSSSSIIRAGTSTATCRRTSAAVPRDRSGRRRAGRAISKQRGLLDDTLVVWGGEFGRTSYCQGKLTADQLRPRPSSALLHHLDGRRRRQAGARPRRDRRLQLQHRRGPVHVHDLHATLLHLLGIDHERLTYLYPGPRLPADRRPRRRGEGAAGVDPGSRTTRRHSPVWAPTSGRGGT